MNEHILPDIPVLDRYVAQPVNRILSLKAPLGPDKLLLQVTALDLKGQCGNPFARAFDRVLKRDELVRALAGPNLHRPPDPIPIRQKAADKDRKQRYVDDVRP